MRSITLTAVLSLSLAGAATAQQTQCTSVDSIAAVGSTRVTGSAVVSRSGLVPNEPICYRDLQRAIELIYSTGQFSDIQISQTVDGSRQVLLIEVEERPMLGRWSVRGAEQLSERKVRGKVELLEGRPYDPAEAARSRARIDSLYKEEGYYLSDVRLRELPIDENNVTVVYEIDEGRRIALSRVIVEGNEVFDDGGVVGHMKTGAEGFWWWKKGEYNEDELDRDRRERLPDFYGSRGFIDFAVAGDTLVVHEGTGKGTLYLEVEEGEQYTVGDFEIVGNRQFSVEQLETLYPFARRAGGFLGLGGSGSGPTTFNQGAWDEATQQVSQLYANNGYIYARITPVVSRRESDNGDKIVDLRWQIVEGSPAILNRVIIRGNNVTHEDVIRRAILMVPGDVFRQEALIRSYQNISNLGFFEQPLPPPTTEQANQQGDIDVIFNVAERHTGNVNFGASVGQGTGVGGFIGLDEPNLFGRGKRIQFQWQFGRNINDFNVSYTDPALRGSLISSTLRLHSSRLRFTVADLGRINSRGVSLQFGFPVMGSRFTRLLTSYSLEQSQYDSPTLSSRFVCDDCVLSTIGLSLVRDTRIGLPFATGGTLHQIAFRSQNPVHAV